mmetsp:Transcript_29896/g.62968  ORF Transcript_29896/g.62968 Transcript_29896/m.62968 type:complete len:213 (-) Transcript_29896:368-1006(-)
MEARLEWAARSVGQTIDEVEIRNAAWGCHGKGWGIAGNKRKHMPSSSYSSSASTASPLENESLTVMSSDDNSQECQEEQQHHIRKKARLSNDNENNENNENEVDVNASADISAMYMMASLIPSTRHFYSFSSNTNNSINASSADTQIGNRMTRATVEQMNHHHRNNGSNQEKTPSEGNSDGLSSWTPSISFNDFGLNENSRKNIDNDNRESE